MWRCDNVGGLDAHVTDMSPVLFLSIRFKKYFFTLFFGSRRARTNGQILTIYTSYDVFPRKQVPIGGLVHTSSHFGGSNPTKTNFKGVNSTFKLNS